MNNSGSSAPHGATSAVPVGADCTQWQCIQLHSMARFVSSNCALRCGQSLYSSLNELSYRSHHPVSIMIITRLDVSQLSPQICQFVVKMQLSG